MSREVRPEASPQKANGTTALPCSAVIQRSGREKAAALCGRQRMVLAKLRLRRQAGSAVASNVSAGWPASWTLT